MRLLLLLAGLPLLIGMHVKTMQDRQTLAAISDSEMLQLLEMAAAKLNAESMPQQIDEITLLMGASAGPGREFTNYYRITSVAAGEVDKVELQDRLRGHVLESACANEGIVVFLKDMVHVNLLYSDVDGAPLAYITEPPNTCN